MDFFNNIFPKQSYTKIDNTYYDKEITAYS
jgi:hypothetical protein